MRVCIQCDLYGGNGIREPGYTYAEYDAEWSAYAADIAAAVPKAPIKAFQGATVAGTTWYRDLTAYAAEHRAQLATVSVHTYPTTHCNGRNVTIAQLLADVASQSEANELTALSLPSDLSALAIPLQLGEGNSASCGGFPNVSNVFASALWALDELYNLAGAGLKGFNFHGGGPSTQSYSALVYANASSDRPLVQPLFYALQMFALGTRGYPRTVSAPIAQTTNPLIKVHATWDGARMAVMLLHKDPTRNPLNESATVVLAFPAPGTFVFPVGEVRRLEAGGLGVGEEWNVTLAGRTWWGTVGGEMRGMEVVEKVSPIRETSSGQYVIMVRPASAVLFEFTTTSNGGGGEGGGVVGTAGWGLTNAVASAAGVSAWTLVMSAALVIVGAWW